MLVRWLIACLMLVMPLSAFGAVYTDVAAQGTSYADLTTAIGAIGNAEVDLYITDVETVNDLTIPEKIRVHFVGGSVNINNGMTLSFATKSIYAPNRPIFGGNGDVDFTAGTVVDVGWFSSGNLAVSKTSDDTVTLLMSKPVSLTSNAVLGNNVKLRWEAPGNAIIIYGGKVFSNVQAIEAGEYQIIAGAGTVSFVDGAYLSSSWFARLRTALAMIDDSKVQLRIHNTETVDVNCSVHANTTLEIFPGGVLSPNAGITLTVNGSTIAHPSFVLSEITAGAGTVTFNGSWGDDLVTVPGGATVGEYLPCIVADGLTDYGDASEVGSIAWCVAQISSKGAGKVDAPLRATAYPIATTIDARDIDFIEFDFHGATLQADTGLTTMFQFGMSTPAVNPGSGRQRNVTIRNVTVDGNSIASKFIKLEVAANFELNNFHISGFTNTNDIVLDLDSGWNILLRRGWIIFPTDATNNNVGYSDDGIGVQLAASYLETSTFVMEDCLIQGGTYQVYIPTQEYTGDAYHFLRCALNRPYYYGIYVDSTYTPSDGGNDNAVRLNGLTVDKCHFELYLNGNATSYPIYVVDSSQQFGTLGDESRGLQNLEIVGNWFTGNPRNIYLQDTMQGVTIRDNSFFTNEEMPDLGYTDTTNKKFTYYGVVLAQGATALGSHVVMTNNAFTINKKTSVAVGDTVEWVKVSTGVIVTPNASTDLFSSGDTPHGYNNNDPVRVRILSGDWPRPIVGPDKIYYIVNSTPTAFKLETSIGAGAIDLASTSWTVTANAGTDVLTTSAAHYLHTGSKVRFTTTDTLPDPLETNIDYYVIYNAGDEIKVALSLAGAKGDNAIDLTDAGTGVHTVSLVAPIVEVRPSTASSTISFSDSSISKHDGGFAPLTSTLPIPNGTWASADQGLDVANGYTISSPWFPTAQMLFVELTVITASSASEEIVIWNSQINGTTVRQVGTAYKDGRTYHFGFWAPATAAGTTFIHLSGVVPGDDIDWHVPCWMDKRGEQVQLFTRSE